MKKRIKQCLQFYRPGDLPPIIVFASPRGGSTWVTELIASQPGLWPFSEPLNVRSKWVQQQLGIYTHAELYDEASLPKVEQYYNRLLAGGFPELKLIPGKAFYKLRTNRIVVKENQGLLNEIPWFEDTFGVQVVHLLRHPIPVALSREEFPLLKGFGRCGLRDRFTATQLQFADRIIAEGKHLQCGVLAWCLHHVPALEDPRDSWLTVTYEETVLQPDRVIDQLVDTLGLHSADLAKLQSTRPSRVIGKSNLQTQELLASGASRELLVQKWKKHVSDAEIADVQEILDVFAVELYAANQFLPSTLEVQL